MAEPRKNLPDGLTTIDSMKRFLICISALLVILQSAFASDGDRLRERVYISTDRDVYVAGDCVWMSAYCVDAATGRLSDFSRIAYVEVHSTAGTVQTAKVALEGGRGAASLTLPNTLATGNYLTDIVEFVEAFGLQVHLEFIHLVFDAENGFRITDIISFNVGLSQQGIVDLELGIKAEGALWRQEDAFLIIIASLYMMRHKPTKIGHYDAIIA